MGFPEEVLFEVELEDMCEDEPSTSEDLAEKEWKQSRSLPGDTCDSTTGEVLDPAKVTEGCDEEIGFMNNMHLWDRVTRDQALEDPEG